MTQVKEIDFMFEIAFNKALPAFYDQANQNMEGTTLINSESKDYPELVNKICLVYDVPSFLTVNKKIFKPTVGFRSIVQHKGYCIDLNEYSDIETYLKDRFSRRSLQRLRSAKKRLELCYDVTYKMYHGTIDKEHYHELFTRFYKMLKLRSIEKGIDNRNLKHWDLYTDRVYDMIINKQASLFVIYDGKDAININLNMHVKNTVFLFITTYDIDYSKFRLGHTNWMMQLDWFIKNNIKIVDFSKGNIEYKKRWSNKEYDFEYHLFYETTNFIIKMKAYWMSKKFQLLQILRDKNINTYYYKTLDWLNRNKESIKITNYQLVDQIQLPEKNTLQPILFRDNDDYFFLKRIIYSYLFQTSIHVDNLKVYKELKNDDIYYFQNQKKVEKLIIEI